jgi:hypothetical protein
MKKSQKQLLSFLFHLAVLSCMVMAYDAAKALAQNMGWIDSREKALDSTDIDLMAKEETLSTEIDPELAKLVTKKGDGLVFRRDIPFPPHIKVIDTTVTKLKKARLAGKSEFGEGSMELSVRDDKVMEYEMAGGMVRFTMKENVSEKVPTAAERLERLKAAEEAIKNKKTPPDMRKRIVDPRVGAVVQFKYDGKAWKALDTREFKTMAWGKDLEDEVGAHLLENSLVPRPRWFGGNPMKPGEVTKISGESLDLVFDGLAEGSLELVLKGMEGVHGHPCAVFEVSGSFVDNDTENALGQTVSSEATIDKGRIWCSLLYPVVLRKDLDVIVSSTTREGANVISKIQGPANEKNDRDWKAVAAKPKEPSSGSPSGKK